ncbi:MAG: methyltransferase [archaeon]
MIRAGPRASPPGPDSLLLLETAKKIIPRDSSILDLGTGTGYIALHLKLSGWARVLASDIDPDAISSAERNFRARKVEIPLFQSDLLSKVPKADWVLFNPPLLGKPAGELSALRKLPLLSALAAALFSKNSGRRAMLAKLVSALGNSKALFVLYRNEKPPRGILVGRKGAYKVWLFTGENVKTRPRLPIA